ncbi:TrkA-N domain-containing protein [Actinopolyspora mzabensis]|uniref:TrkA-N domain-containing protein n=1 Tax=Actinopolyspora mzabensis TaxID=995066 RepID=A0A1G8Y0T0_ACTMZ|nr:NAD-binding protein [Actinopolyspora mzabensis]SDJ96381.1 TrkA-N domain-containing protein [Actinopolyspora mzabensis]
MSANTSASLRSGTPSRVVVIGLGRFGGSLALELTKRGSDVLALDTRAHLVQQFADEVTHAAVADTTDPETLRQLDVPEFPPRRGGHRR